MSPPPEYRLPFPPLTEGRLIKRYKRFLADVEFPDGTVVTAHTNNTGAMLDCSEPCRPVFLSYNPNPKRAHPWGWEMISMPDSLVGVNTLLPNRLAALAAAGGALTSGIPPAKVTREVRVGSGPTRLDLSITTADGTEILVEVKSSTLVRDQTALFPDAVSLRGTRHLSELAALASAGRRALLLVLVQRDGSVRFSPADGIDPAWGAALRAAVAQGVELSVHEVALDLTVAAWGREIPSRL